MRARIARLRKSPRTSRRSGHTPDRPSPAPVATRRPEARVREAGGPEDRASYTCSCGYVFEADVSTSVACPHCGASQAW